MVPTGGSRHPPLADGMFHCACPFRLESDARRASSQANRSVGETGVVVAAWQKLPAPNTLCLYSNTDRSTLDFFGSIR